MIFGELGSHSLSPDYQKNMEWLSKPITGFYVNCFFMDPGGNWGGEEYKKRAQPNGCALKI
jgi:hypothetical protein